MPGMVFLLWLWVAFLARDVGCSWTTREAKWLLCWGDGEVAMIHRVEEHRSWRQWGWEYFDYHLKIDGEEDKLVWRQAVTILNHHGYGAHDRGVSFALWLLVILYGALWFGSAAFSQHRRHQLLKRGP